MARQTGSYLDRILTDTAATLAARTDLLTAPPAITPARGFARALAASGISLIAEVKKASPSRGIIREDFHPAHIAATYQAAGAAAISVLTDEKYFQGKLSYLDDVRAAVTLPLLRKDFIIHPAQIYEAVGRADAVLLIVAALSTAELAELLGIATACGLDALVEVHDRAELDVALETGATIIGINNRNLRTFQVELRTTFDLLAYLPDTVLVVSESGIRTGEDAAELEARGVNAMLVGEALMVEQDIGAKVRALLRR